MLIAEAIELYLSRPNLAESTKKSYSVIFRQFLAFHGNCDVGEVELAHLLRFIAMRRAKGNTPRSLNLLTNFFKSFFGWLWRCEYIEQSPAAKLEGVHIDAIPDDERAISPADWQKIKAYCKEHSKRDYALLAFLLDSACRVSAAVGLTLGDLYLDSYRAYVYESKISSRVEVSFGAETANALRVWLEARPEVSHDAVFTTVLAPYGAIKTQSVREMMKRACAAAGTQAWSPHSLRHATLQHLAHQPGVTLLDVQTKANHLNPATTLNSYYPQKSLRVGELTKQYSLVNDNPPPESYPPLRILPKNS